MSPAPDGIGEEGRFSPGDEASLAALEARLTWRLIGLVVGKRCAGGTFQLRA